MNRQLARTLVVCLITVPAFSQSLNGRVTDPSGASVPGALVQLLGPGGQKRASTNELGDYSFATLSSGKYTVRFIAKGFSVREQRGVEIRGPVTLDAMLKIEAQSQVLNVEEEANSVSTDAAANGTAVVLREKELAALSDDPDELSQQLQALAGPSAGPNGGQIFIDGFSGRSLPSKSSIREVRINSNPYAAEFDRPGFGRIEILTKPGSDTMRGQLFHQFNNQYLNSRSPLLAQSTRTPYSNQFFGANISGPIKKQKASYGLDFERRQIDENAFVLATIVDSNLNPQAINEGIVTPQRRTNFSARLDYSINPSNTLAARYQLTRVALENEGIGGFNLTSRAYSQADSENTFQLTETAILGARAVSETRFQFLRTNLARTGDNSIPAISVQGAFDGGGAQIGNSGSIQNRFEVSNITTYTQGAHTIKWGARLRHSQLDDTSVNNFGGTYVFFGGQGPVLDANNQPVAGAAPTQLSALERYRRTLLFQRAGLPAARIRELGGGASQFTSSGGTPLTSIGQFDAGVFLSDDWRVQPRLTVNYGLRYEAQTNFGGLRNWAPRIGMAYALDGGGGRPSKTVLRLGYGIFYDRVNPNVTLNQRRFDGVTQQAYLLRDPDTYPAIPAISTLLRQPQQLQLVESGLNAPRLLQASVGLERQVTSFLKLSSQYINGRGLDEQRSRNINTPVNGIYPFGDRQLRVYTESAGSSRANMLIVSPNVNYKKLFLFGFYSLGYGSNNTEGQPADPYNLRAEWGPSSFADVRHRFLMGTALPLPFKFTVNPFLIFSTGAPYNITTGRDANGDGFTADRPLLVAGRTAGNCSGGSLVYARDFGCFDLSGIGGTPIGRNIGRGPSNFNLSLRLSRTWAFGDRGESGPADGGGLPPGMGGIRGGGPPPGGPGGGGPPPGMGPPSGLFGPNSGKKYNLMLSISARNAINHSNYSAPNGDLSSPYFGEYRSLAGFGPFAGASTYNRKIDIQLRFTF